MHVKDPESFEEAYPLPEVEKEIKWRRAISKEFEEMIARRFPTTKNCIKNKWNFKAKRNGIFQSRCTGVDFHESYEPVINDVTFRIFLVTMVK
jgi:hypothetical protein